MGVGALAVAGEWLDAVNRADGDRLERLSTEESRSRRARGSARADRHAFPERPTRAGFSATSRRWFCGRGGGVVVEQDARWVDLTTGEVTERARLASQFLVEGARVATYVRHDESVNAALRAAGLEQADEVTERGGRT